MLVLAALDQTILSTALPAIVQELQGQDRLSWVFSAYLMASTVAIPLYGRLADLHGARPLLLVAIALFGLGSLSCGLASSMNQLIAARTVQGAGGGGLMTLTMLGVAHLVPYPRRASLQSLLGASYGLAVMFGPLVGGVLVQHLSWHWAFFINLPVALAALPVIARAMPATASREGQSVDLLGAALLAAALVSLLLATRRGADAATAWLSTGLMLALSAVLTLSFLQAQRRAKHPILPLSLFSQPAFAAAAALSACAGVALFSAVVFLPMYLQTVLRLTPTDSAWHLLPLMAGLTLSAITSGRLLRAHGRLRGTALAACALMMLGFVALVVVFRWAPDQAIALSACVLPLGMGIGMLLPLVIAVSQRTAPPEHLGVATSTPIMVRALGGAVGVSALGAMLAQEMAARLGVVANPGRAAVQSLGARHEAYGSAFAGAAQPVYATVAGVCLLTLLAAWVLPARAPSAAHSPGPHKRP